MRYPAAYLAGLLIMGALDALWLGVLAKDLYRNAIGHLIADEPRLGVAAVFYLLYAAGMMLFAVMPAVQAGSVGHALGLGALFGFFAYMTYDLSNLATLRGWPLRLVVIDIAWGTALSTVMAGAAWLVADHWPR